MEEISRRKLLQLGLTGIAGLATSSSFLSKVNAANFDNINNLQLSFVKLIPYEDYIGQNFLTDKEINEFLLTEQGKFDLLHLLSHGIASGVQNDSLSYKFLNVIDSFNSKNRIISPQTSIRFISHKLNVFTDSGRHIELDNYYNVSSVNNNNNNKPPELSSRMMLDFLTTNPSMKYNEFRTQGSANLICRAACRSRDSLIRQQFIKFFEVLRYTAKRIDINNTFDAYSFTKALQQIQCCNNRCDLIVLLPPRKFKLLQMSKLETCMSRFKNIYIYEQDFYHEKEQAIVWSTEKPLGLMYDGGVTTIEAHEPTKMRWGWVSYKEIGIAINPQANVMELSFQS